MGQIVNPIHSCFVFRNICKAGNVVANLALVTANSRNGQPYRVGMPVFVAIDYFTLPEILSIQDIPQHLMLFQHIFCSYQYGWTLTQHLFLSVARQFMECFIGSEDFVPGIGNNDGFSTLFENRGIEMDGFFSLSSLGNILYGPHRTDRFALVIIECLAMFNHPFYTAIRHQQAMRYFIGFTGRQRIGISLVDLIPIFRVNGIQERFIGCSKLCLIDFKNAKDFI